MIFLFPTEFEAAQFRAAEPSAEVVVSGVGMAATAATLAQLLSTIASHRVILAGIAGAYDLSKHPLNSVVEVASESIEELPERFSKRYDIEPCFGLPTASSCCVNRSNFEGAKSDIENMEGAAAAAICEAMQIPFSEIRAISNRVGDPFKAWSVDGAIEALTSSLIDIYNR